MTILDISRYLSLHRFLSDYTLRRLCSVLSLSCNHFNPLTNSDVRLMLSESLVGYFHFDMKPITRVKYVILIALIYQEKTLHR